MTKSLELKRNFAVRRYGMTKRHTFREACEHPTTTQVVRSHGLEKPFKMVSRLVCTSCGRHGPWGWELNEVPIPTGAFPTFWERVFPRLFARAEAQAIASEVMADTRSKLYEMDRQVDVKLARLADMEVHYEM